MFVTPIVKSRWKIQTINRQKQVLVKSNISMPCSQSWFFIFDKKDYLFTVSQLKTLKRNYRLQTNAKKRLLVHKCRSGFCWRRRSLFFCILYYICWFFMWNCIKCIKSSEKKRKKKCIHRIWKTFKVIECMIVDRK